MVGAQPPSHRLRKGSRAPGRAVRPLAVGSPHSASKRLRGLGSHGLLVLRRAAHRHQSHRPEPVHAAPERLDFLVIGALHRACQAASRSSTLVVSSKSGEHVTRSIALLPVIISKARRMRAPNPSIEATAQSPLRALWAAPHVER
jgi:hypothetical protein